MVWQLVPYQKVVFRGRTLAWGVGRSATYHVVFPASPTGRTILDVGCNAGAYCFMAIEEGAQYCLGVDNNSGHTARGRAALRRAGVANLEIVTTDALTYAGDEFDIVLCLNVLQHLGTVDRIEFLIEKLLQMTRERLIVICPLPDSPSCTYQYAFRGKEPYVLLSAEYFRAKWGHHVVDFAPLEPSFYSPNRALITVWKGKHRPRRPALLPDRVSRTRAAQHGCRPPFLYSTL
jgi:SAM-dependent methyltransferase